MHCYFRINLFVFTGICECVSPLVVAFTVEKSDVYRPRDDYEQMSYDTVLTLQGDGLSSHNSSMTFRAPVSGLYVFSVTVIADGDSAAPVEMFLNQQSIGLSGRRSSSSTGTFPLGSASLNIMLQEGDIINLMARPLDAGFLGIITGLFADPSHVIFSGHLQQATDF